MAMQQDDLIFVIGLLRGAVEGDPTRHFGSLRSWTRWQTLAVQCGVVELATVTVDVDGAQTPVLTEVPTDYGREFHARHDLAALPAGRAYLWPKESLAAAVAELATVKT